MFHNPVGAFRRKADYKNEKKMKKHAKKTVVVIKARGNSERGVWTINPVTRVAKDRSVYDRKRAKQDVRREVRNYV